MQEQPLLKTPKSADLAPEVAELKQQFAVLQQQILQQSAAKQEVGKAPTTLACFQFPESHLFSGGEQEDRSTEALEGRAA